MPTQAYVIMRHGGDGAAEVKGKGSGEGPITEEVLVTDTEVVEVEASIAEPKVVALEAFTESAAVAAITESRPRQENGEAAETSTVAGDAAAEELAVLAAETIVEAGEEAAGSVAMTTIFRVGGDVEGP